MKKSEAAFTIGILILIGVLLRVIDLTIPDLATDEAQAMFAGMGAWTPLGMWLLEAVRFSIADELVAIRSVSVVFGIITLPLIYLTAREFTNVRTAALATVIAALFPSHILFSRLAYLSIQLCFWWIAVLYCFLKARKSEKFIWYLLLFLTGVAATMTKTQGLLFPLLLLAGTVIEKRKLKLSIINYLCRAGLRHPLSITLALSLVPFTFYFLTHPNLAGTLFLYGGNMYGVSGPLSRLVTLISTWWHVIGLFLIAIVLSFKEIRRLPWPFLTLMILGTVMGYFLGAGHEYYTTHLILWSIPIAMTLIKLKSALRSISVAILLLFAIVTFGPTGLMQNKWTYDLYGVRGFWNSYSQEINEILKDEEAVTVLGDVGHHVRWYLEPRVLVGKDMESPYPTNIVILFSTDDADRVSGKIVSVIEHLAVVRQNEG